jgi:hypothetical protein
MLQTIQLIFKFVITLNDFRLLIGQYILHPHLHVDYSFCTFEAHFWLFMDITETL